MSVVVAVISSQLSTSSSTLCSDCSLPRNFVNGCVVNYRVFCCPHSQTADLGPAHTMYVSCTEVTAGAVG